MLRFPPELTFHPEATRTHLRGAFASRVPDAVRLRRHKPLFDSLRADSLSGFDGLLVRKLLLAPETELRAYIRPGVLRELLDHPEVEGPATILRLATTECWLREQAQPGFVADLLTDAPLRHFRPVWKDAL